jgi:hypothetical protein
MQLVWAQSASSAITIALIHHNFRIIVATIAYAAFIQDNCKTLDFKLVALSAASLF